MTPLIATHALLATLALLSGGLALWTRLPPSTPSTIRPGWHRAAGYVFVVSMLGAASTAFFIRDVDGWNWRGFTPIHLLIPLAVVGIARAIWHVRQRHVAAHRRVMRMVYFGGCVVAGLFTLMPERIIGHWLWTSLGLL